MKSEEVVRFIKGRYPGTDVRIARERRVMVHIPSGLLIEMLAFLKDHGVTHLSTISAVDRIKENLFELLYHLYWENNEISVRIEIPRETPFVPTVTGVLPGALTFEREIQDMFGIRVDHIPNPEKLLLPDNWPAGEYPLRKDYVVK
jgi:NADH:ubiquinone oxidoreductase subunit C